MGSLIAGVSALNWPVFFVGGKETLNNVVAVKILSANIPFSYYVFTSNNNVFEVSTDNSTWVTVTIPVGNYTADTMQATLQSIITTAIGAVTVTYSQSTMKYTFVAAGIYFKFPLGEGFDNPRLWIGFNSGTQGGTVSYTAPNAALLSGPNYLYINSTTHGQTTNNYRPRGVVESGNTGPQMACVPVNTDSGNIIFYTDPGTFFLMVDPQKYFSFELSSPLQKIDFYLSLGNNETMLDLNGLSFSLKLGILLRKMNHDETFSGFDTEGGVLKKFRPY
ncbi:MAG: hypothetical protein V4708_17460 [Bacteroidota bacterium]